MREKAQSHGRLIESHAKRLGGLAVFYKRRGGDEKLRCDGSAGRDTELFVLPAGGSKSNECLETFCSRWRACDLLHE